MSKSQLKNLIAAGNISPSSRPTFKIEQFISQLSKEIQKDPIYYNYDNLSCKTKDEVDRVLKNTQ